MPANNAAREALARFLTQRGVEADGVVGNLEAYEALLRRWNARQNLVSRRDAERLRDRHVVDSLALLPWWSGNLADVGSGAGFPGVPLAIARPASSVVLVERSERKARFLRQVVIELALANVEVVLADVDGHNVGRSLRGRLFDTITVRAVAPPDEAWKLVRGLLAPAGSALLQSGVRLDAGLFDNGVIRHREHRGGTWITVVGATPGGGKLEWQGG